MYGLEFISKGKEITNEDIKSFEIKYKFSFPADLQSLLLIHNGGDLEMNSFFRLTGNSTFTDSAVERIASLSEIEAILLNLADDEGFMSSQILPFAQLLGTRLVGIGLDVNTLGKIYVFDWDYGITYQAGSLLEFFQQLLFEDASDLRKNLRPNEKHMK